MFAADFQASNRLNVYKSTGRTSNTAIMSSNKLCTASCYWIRY